MVDGWLNNLEAYCHFYLLRHAHKKLGCTATQCQVYRLFRSDERLGCTHNQCSVTRLTRGDQELACPVWERWGVRSDFSRYLR